MGWTVVKSPPMMIFPSDGWIASALTVPSGFGSHRSRRQKRQSIGGIVLAARRWSYIL